MASSDDGGKTGYNAQPPDEERPQMQDDCYKMDSVPRGLCYIFNNKRYEGRKSRFGSEKDRDLLEKVWKTLQFEVRTFDDLRKQEMEEKLQELARLDVHKDNDCVVVIFLTHGDNGAVQGSDNEWLTIDSIISPFKAANCPLLAGKPKLFFFQSCRGEETQEAVPVQSNVDGGKTPAATKIKDEVDKMVLTEADFFLSFATVVGTRALRNEETGSWFIQELVQTLRESADREDLDSLMTTIRRRVNNHHCETADGTFVVQTAESKTTLLKKIYFKGKVSRENNGSTGQSNQTDDCETQITPPIQLHSHLQWWLVESNVCSSVSLKLFVLSFHLFVEVSTVVGKRIFAVSK
ncbi:caspase-3-like [Haliotis cracherodii]|uniref:caspase-3-like n=1 Tax=Haliotis cracherodii TaxID=6455 RepID=UPI0039E99002